MNSEPDPDLDWESLELRVEKLSRLVTQLQPKTQSFVDPRRSSIRKAIKDKVLHQQPSSSPQGSQQPQPEDSLGHTMRKQGLRLGEDSELGKGLVDYADSLTRLSEMKTLMQDSVHGRFIDPMGKLEKVDMKQVAQHLKNLRSRRSDAERAAKKTNLSTEEVAQTTEKLEEAEGLARASILNILATEDDQLRMLAALIEDQRAFHSGCVSELEALEGRLGERIVEASRNRKGPRERSLKREEDEEERSGGESEAELRGTEAGGAVVDERPRHDANDDVVCEALFDFDAANANEMKFVAGESIVVVSVVDDDWLWGKIGDDRVGFVPRTFVRMGE